MFFWKRLNSSEYSKLFGLITNLEIELNSLKKKLQELEMEQAFLRDKVLKRIKPQKKEEIQEEEQEEGEEMDAATLQRNLLGFK